MKYLQKKVKRCIISGMKYITRSADETRRVAAVLAEKLRVGDILFLEGELGAGKTAFVKGLAQGLGVTRTVTSPTFNYVREYPGRLPLFHFDMYRIADADEAYDLGLEEYLSAGGVCAVEWNKFTGVKPRFVVSIKNLGEDEREITVDEYSCD